MPINAVLTEDLLKRIDEVASEQKKSRSRFIREATERYIAEHEQKKEKEEGSVRPCRRGPGQDKEKGREMARCGRDQEVAGESPVKACVIDSSVAVKWFSAEEGTEAALALRDEAFSGKPLLEAPDFLLYEIGNVLRYNPRLEADDVKVAVGSLMDLGIIFHPADMALLSRAVDLAFRYRMTVYDGCFTALADIRSLPLITADEKLATRAADHPKIVRLSDA